jgi:hypothetical protein
MEVKGRLDDTKETMKYIRQVHRMNSQAYSIFTTYCVSTWPFTFCSDRIVQSDRSFVDYFVSFLFRDYDAAA